MSITPVDIEDNKINHYSLFSIEPDGVKTARFFCFSGRNVHGDGGDRYLRPHKGMGRYGDRYLRPPKGMNIIDVMHTRMRL